MLALRIENILQLGFSCDSEKQLLIWVWVSGLFCFNSKYVHY